MKRLAQLALGALAWLALAPAAVAAPIVTGQINDGNTFLSSSIFNFGNASTAGESINSLTFTIPGTFFFDTTSAAPGTAPSGPSISINPGGAIITAPDGTSSLSVTFTDFDPTESFSFGVDVDSFANPDDTVLGSQLVGSTVSGVFSNGATFRGTFVDDGIPNNGIAAVLQVENVPEPAGIALWTMLLLAVAAASLYLKRRSAAPVTNN